MKKLEQLSNWLVALSKGWLALLALVVFLLFTALVLPAQSRETQKYAGSAGSPDTSFFYTSRDLYQTAEIYGQAGRDAYIHARFTFDIIFPLVYLFFLATTISWAVSKAFPLGSPWRLLNLFPVAGALFDFLENIATSLVMWRYPTHTPLVDFLAPFFTTLKWFFVNGSFIVLLVVLLIALVQWAKHKTGK